MVSIVTGGGAGLVNSSKDVLGGAGEIGNAAWGRAGERVTVNAATGNLVVQDRDEYLVGMGPDVDLLRTYNSQGGWEGDSNVDGWRIGYYRRVSNVGGSLKRIDADGHEAIYSLDASSGKYLTSEGSGQFDSLSFSAGVWTWTDGDTGTTETYASVDQGVTYRLTQVTDTNNRAVKILYDGNGLISTLSTYKNAANSTADEVVTLNYSGTQLSKITTSYKDAQGVQQTRSVTSYGYTNGRLSLVTTDLTPDDATDNATKPDTLYTVSYAYDGNGRLQAITQKDGSTQIVDYWADGRVKSIKDDQNRLTGFVHDTANRITTVTDPLGQITQLKYDTANQLLEISGALLGGGSLKQSYSYGSTGDVLTSTNAKNEVTTYEYASGGKLLRRTDAAGNVLERTYTANGLVASETTYSVADTDGAAGPLKASGARTTSYYYDATTRRLCYTINADGTLLRYSYDSYGNLTDRFDHSAQFAFSGDRNTWSAVQAFIDNAFNTDVDVHRQRYTYDARGLLASVQGYDSGKFDSQTKVFVGGAVLTTDYYVYDAFNRLLSKKDANNKGITYLYDGLNRLTQSVDANNAITLYTYDDTNRKTSVKLDNGLTTVQIFDTQGRLVSSDVLGASSQVALGATKYFYDAAGQLRRVQDATGVSSHVLYDVSGRKSADMAANGQLTEYLYDAAGRLIQTVAYAKLVDVAKQALLTDVLGRPTSKTVTDIRPAVDGDDRITTFYYDAAGRLTGTLDADGYLTENTYDGTSALTTQRRYSNTVAVTRLDASLGTTRDVSLLKPAPVADAVRDRLTRNLYDAFGKLAARVDGDGGLTVWKYDAAGNMLSQLRRSQLLGDTDRTNGTLATLSALAPLADDEFTQWIYDGQGRQIAMLSAEGYLTEYRYDGTGRPSDTVRYLTQARKPLTGTSLNLINRADLGTLRPSLGTPLTSTITYNSRGLLETEKAVDGTITFYDYDQLQRLKTKTLAYQTTGARSQSIDYDDWGRVLGTKTVGDATSATTTYDAAGRRTSAKDARGNTTFFYYDTQGRQVYAILRDPILGGEVTETIYSNFNEVQVTVTHAKRLSAADSAALAGGKTDGALDAKVAALSNAGVDNRRTVSYNRRGLLQQAIDALGYKTDYRYNGFGQLSQEIRDADATGTANARRLTLDHGYDRRGDLTRTERSGAGLANGVITGSSFDALGRLSTSTDELNRLTQYTYLRDSGGGTGRKLTIAGPAGTASTTYDALDRVLTRVDRNANTVTYTHDAVNRTLTVKTAENIQTVTEYNRTGEVCRITDGAGATTTYAYDAHGNLLAVTDALGNLTQNGYDTNDNLVQVIRGLRANAGGNPINDGSATTTSYSFDAANRVLTQTVDPLVNGVGLNLQTRYEYDGQGRKLKITDPRGTVSTQIFNAKGELTDVIIDDANGGLKLKTSYSYDAESRVLTVIEGAGTAAARKTAYAYDILGRRLSETVDPEGLKLKTSYEYDAAGRLTVRRDALNNVIARYTYDGADLLRCSVDALGAVTRYVYDGEGHIKGFRVYATPLAAGWASKTYDELSAALDALSTSSADLLYVNGYDKDGRLIYSVDALGQVTERKYDGANRVVLERQYSRSVSGVVVATTTAVIAAQVAAVKDDTRDHVIRYAFDKAGNQRFVINAEGYVSELRYDAAGRVVASVDHEQAWTASINAVPTEADLMATYSPARTEFNTGLEGISGAAGLWEAGRFKLVSEPVSNGGWVYSTSSKKMPVGSVLKLEYLPVQIQQMPHIMLKDGAGGLGRVAVIFKNDGHVYAQRRQPVTDVKTEFDLGTYTPGKTYCIEIDSTATGGRIFVYEKGTAIASGMSTTLTEPTMNWQSVQLEFAVQRTPTLQPGQTISYVDNIEELPPVKGRVTQFAYDAAGRQRFAVDAEGYVTETRYDDANARSTTLRYANRLSGANAYSPSTYAPALSAFTAALSGLGTATSVVQELDRAGRVSLQTDGNGVQTQFTYDAVGRLQTEVQASNIAGQSSTTRYVYNAAGQRTALIRGDGTALASTTRYEYDSFGRLWHEIDARGVALAEGTGAWEVVERIRLGVSSTPASLSASDKAALLKAYTTEYAYDADNRVIKITDALGGVSQTDYDSFGNASVITDARGYKRYQVYDRGGHLVQSIDAERYLTVYGYDAFGNLTSTTRVDAKVQGTLAAGQAVVLASAAPSNGVYVLTNAANDHTTGRLYDRNSRLLKETDAENYTEGTDALDAYGQRLAVKNKLGATVTYSYDRLGRVLTETLPVQAKDGAGVLRDVVNEYQYDSRGNRIVSIEAKGLVEQRTTQMRYDGVGRLTLRVGMSYTAVAADNTNSTVIPADAWHYDARGNLIEQISHGQLAADGINVLNGKRSVAYYDVLDEKTAEVSADRVASTFSYDRAGNQVAQTVLATRIASTYTLDSATAPTAVLVTNAADDRTLRMRYDALDRKVETSIDNFYIWDSGAVDPAISNLQRRNIVLQQFFYDATGNLVERKDGRGNSSFEYFDGIGRCLLAIDAGGAGIAWEYSRSGAAASRETHFAGMLPGGYLRQASTLAGANGSNTAATLIATYSGLSLKPGEQNRIVTYALDRLDRTLEKRVLNVAQDYVSSNGTRTQSTSDAITQYAYNGLGAVKQIKELASVVGNTQTWEQTDIGYDLLNREIRRETPAFVDFENQQVRPTTDTEYDGLGQVIRSIKRGKLDNTEADDRITQYRYDANGLLTQVTDAAAAITRYSYDSLGNMSRRTSVAVHRSDGTARDLVKTYGYDAAGRVTVESDLDTGEIRKSRYSAFGDVIAKGLGDGEEEFAEYNVLGKVSKTNAGNGAIKFYVYDACGNLTREIFTNGGDGFSPMTIDEAATGVRTYYRVSLYNSRNLLVKTIDPQISLLQPGAELSQLYTNKWVSAWVPGATVANSYALPDITVSGTNGAVPMLNLRLPGAVRVSTGGGTALSIMFSTYVLDGSGMCSIDVSGFKGAGTKTFPIQFYDNSQYGGDGAMKGGGVSFSVDAAGNVSASLMYGNEPVTYRPAALQWADIGPAVYSFNFVDPATGQSLYSATDMPGYSPFAEFTPPPRGAFLEMPSFLRPAAGQPARNFDILCNVGGGTSVIHASYTSAGTLSISQEAGARPGQMFFYIKGRNVPKAQLTIDGRSVTANGTYFPATGASFGYTQFTFDGGAFDFSSGEKYFKLQGQDAAGQPLRDEFGGLIAQSGKVVFSSADRPPEVLNQFYYINISPKVVISRLQDFNAFGEVSEERDERVGERMLAAINDDRKSKGLAALTALSAEQQDAARTTLQYNVLGQLVAKIDPETFVTAANGYRYRARPITSYGYDLLGRHTTTTDANGNLSRMGHLAGARGEEGASQFEFDAAGGTAAAFDATKGGMVQTQRDIFGDVRRLIDAELHVTEQSYDNMGRLVTATRRNVQRFDALGAKLARTDLIDRYEYDELGQRIRATNALQASNTTDYDGLGRVTRTVSAQGAVVTYKYDYYDKSAQRIAAMYSPWASPQYSGGYIKTTTLADGRTLSDAVEYFGHLVHHEDMTGAFTNYNYDSAGQLALQTGSYAYTEYRYYANGYISSIADRTSGTGSSYGYDNSGNRVSESHYAVDYLGRRDASLDFQSQDNTIVRDELNRIIRVYDPQSDGKSGRLDVHYEYDAMGNRRLVDSVYFDGAAGLLDRQTYWYAYDALNRFTITKGQLNTTDNSSASNARFYSARRGSSVDDSTVFVVAGVEGTVIGYDKISQRISADYTYNGTAIAETYAYSDDGYLQLTRQNGQLKTSRELDVLGRTTFQHDLQSGATPGSTVALRHTQSLYDSDNRLLKQLYVDDTDAARNYVLSYFYYDRPADVRAKTDAVSASTSATGFGALAKTTLHPGNVADASQDTVTTYSYLYGDEAQQLKITKAAPGVTAGVTDFFYDGNGHLKSTIDRISGATNTYFTTADGLVLSRTRTQPNARTSHHAFFYADTNRIGDVGDTPDEITRVSYAEQLALKDVRRQNPNAKGRTYAVLLNSGSSSELKYGSTADFDQNYEPINDDYPGHAASLYTVQRDNESLASIARDLWGDASMWYLIGDANRLSKGAVLKRGQSLVIPNKVTNIHNNSATWRPYQPGEVIGRTEPTLPTQHLYNKGPGEQERRPGFTPPSWYHGRYGAFLEGLTNLHFAQDVASLNAAQASAAAAFQATYGFGNARLGESGGQSPIKNTYALPSTGGLGSGLGAGMSAGMNWMNLQLSTSYSFTGSLAGQLGSLGLGVKLGGVGVESQGLSSVMPSAFGGSLLPPADNATNAELMAYQLQRAGFGGEVQDVASQVVLPGLSYPDGSGWGRAAPWEKAGARNWTTWGQREYITEGGLKFTTNVLPAVEITGKSVATLALDAAPVVRELAAPISLTRIELAAPFTLGFGFAPDSSLPDALPTVAMAVQELNDAKAIEGTLNTTSEAVAAAWRGDLALARAHWNYEPSPEARAAIYERINPSPDPRFARIDSIRNSGLAGIVSLAGHAAGASSTTLDRLAQSGELAEGSFGQLSGFRLPRYSGANTYASPANRRPPAGATQDALRAYLDQKFGRVGDLNADITARADLQAEMDRLAREGHAPGRHGPRVTERALDNRVLYEYDPITGKTTDYYTRGTHKVGRNATKIVTGPAMLQAEAYVRGTPEFAVAEANAKAQGQSRMVVEGIPLEYALGAHYLTVVFGKARVGSSSNPVGTVPIDFTNGTLTAIFRKTPGGYWNLHTMYPEPQ
ncbi:hypothetical protein ACS5PN_10175 [Roseateles sp. NT4]|uniref:hypothetical protein n=1 Tax=Roseateles sp. NT4 TaxID=3453715 RepID=UPI003EEB11B5